MIWSLTFLLIVSTNAIIGWNSRLKGFSPHVAVGIEGTSLGKVLSIRGGMQVSQRSLQYWIQHNHSVTLMSKSLNIHLGIRQDALWQDN